MISEFNINIFNYIYSKNIEIEKRIIKDNDSITKRLNDIIKKYYELEEFWKENAEMFDNTCIEMITDIIGSDTTYNHFPMLIKKSKIEFLDFKCQQIQEIIEDKGCIKLEDYNNIFVNMEDIAIKNILKYCKKNNIIDFEENKTIIEGGQTGVALIYYDNIEPVLCKSGEQKSLFTQHVIQNINYGDNYGTFNQSNNFQNNDERLFQTVLEKINALQIESNISKEKIKDIKEACNKKEKNKVINFLKEIAMGTGTNLIASGILGMFGIM